MIGYLGVWGGFELTSLKLSSTPLFLLIYLAKFLLKKKKEEEKEEEEEEDRVLCVCVWEREREIKWWEGIETI